MFGLLFMLFPVFEAKFEFFLSQLKNLAIFVSLKENLIHFYNIY